MSQPLVRRFSVLPRQAKHLYLLDLLRGIGSLAVVVWHYEHFFSAGSARTIALGARSKRHRGREKSVRASVWNAAAADIGGRKEVAMSRHVCNIVRAPIGWSLFGEGYGQEVTSAQKMHLKLPQRVPSRPVVY
jgi:hypothetical protein